MNFYEAFNQFILKQPVTGLCHYPPYGDHSNPLRDYCGDGVVLANGYKYISFGGGAAGEDVNYKAIIDNNDNFVAGDDF